MTDIHLQAEKNADIAFVRAIDTINKLDPDFVITGGDLVMDASRRSESRADSLYDMYIELSGLLNMPVYNTIGNNDMFGIYEQSGVDVTHPLYAEKMYEDRIGPTYYAFNYLGWRFYILDSVEDKEDRSGYQGHIHSEQLAWLEEDLTAVDSNTPLVIISHIPFNVKEIPLDPEYVPHFVDNTGEVLSLFNGYNLELVLHGHFHMLAEVEVSGVTYILGGAVSGDWWNGPRGDMQEGFVVFYVYGDDFEWEYIDYGWDAG
ncbi:MAG: metallophosphoesterase [Bacteroidales bacterium]|jgi:3',5'-cyclic AMP phosphodiesterase CpdA|nr:metallophosphoesterase [Bacteroidales bacterium]